MELFDVIRSRMLWFAIAAFTIVFSITALAWPALGVFLMVGVVAVGAVAACVFFLYELGVLARKGNQRSRDTHDTRHQEPEVSISRTTETDSVYTPIDRR